MAKLIKSAYIFRRDLRLKDNTALNNAVTNSQVVVPIFIFDDRQLKDNGYKSDNCLQFMQDSLKELDLNLQELGGQLYLLSGIAHEVIEQLILKEKIEGVFFNYDYTPFSIERDKQIKKVCKKHDVGFFPSHDLGLATPGKVLKDDGEPYTVYTYYRKKAEKLEVNKPKSFRLAQFYNEKLKVKTHKADYLEYDFNHQIAVSGGRSECLKILKKLPSNQDYQGTRDIPALDATTKLSAHCKFGTISAREIFHVINKQFNSQHTLIQQLHWRDFFMQIAYYFPYVFGSAFHAKYKKINWSKNKNNFQAWCQGQTGFPIVDAGMRELNATGFMHNRVRMIVASFLTKDLHINWQWGEKYFAQKLVDYDPAVNNGNWQWAASTGCDAQPYFRIFNPWRQQERFDPKAEYIKKWVSELNDVDLKNIHKQDFFDNSKIPQYPRPIVNHLEAKEKAIELYKNI